MSFDFASSDTLLDIDAICRKLGVSRSTFERLRSGEAPMRINSLQSLMGQADDFVGMAPFPQPTVRLGRSPRWSVKVLNSWINGTRDKAA